MKKAIVILLAAALCLMAAGCGSFLDGVYVATERYEDELPVVEGDSVIVDNDQRLRNAILALVDAHQAEETLTFTGYEGDISGDLSRICSELKAENALCAYAVDYISYDLSQIVSYYEARIFINYLHSAEEMAQLRNIGSVINASDAVCRAVQEGKESVVFSAIGSALTDADVQSMAEDFYYSAPTACLYLPKTSLSVYPNAGIYRIYEVKIDYGTDAASQVQKLGALTDAVTLLADTVSGEDDAARAENAARLLAERCTWSGTDSGSDATAYGALVENQASCSGFAMAYKALCDQLEIECIVVRGRMDKTPHAWNLISLGENYYHVDVSQMRLNRDADFLLSDSAMRSSYWWDIDAYPAAADVTLSPEATESPAPEGTGEDAPIPAESAEPVSLDLKLPNG